LAQFGQIRKKDLTFCPICGKIGALRVFYHFETFFGALLRYYHNSTTTALGASRLALNSANLKKVLDIYLLLVLGRSRTYHNSTTTSVGALRRIG
jgi:hypothetical protein